MTKHQAEVHSLKLQIALLNEGLGSANTRANKANERAEEAILRGDKAERLLADARANSARDLKLLQSEIARIRECHAHQLAMYRLTIDALLDYHKDRGRVRTWTHPDGGKIEVAMRIGDIGDINYHDRGTVSTLDGKPEKTV